MKKTAMIIACLFLGVSLSQAMPPINDPAVGTFELMQDKVKINPEDLPEPVKKAIAENDEVNHLQVSQAYKVTDDDKVYYEVTFGLENESITKKYDSEGGEIEEVG
jgi:hypothetical protein